MSLESTFLSSHIHNTQRLWYFDSLKKCQWKTSCINHYILAEVASSGRDQRIGNFVYLSLTQEFYESVLDIEN